MQLDRWVLDQACSLAAGWPGHLQVSSNLSAANVFAGNLAEDVQAALLRRGVAPGRLKLEITETVLRCDPTRVRNIVAALRELGVHVVLDDFGVGHASIGSLRDYAFDGLKIDRSFVADVEAEPRSRAFVRAIIQMARALGIGGNGQRGWRRRVSCKPCASRGSRPFRASAWPPDDPRSRGDPIEQYPEP